MSDDSLPEIKKEALLARARHALDTDMIAEDETVRGETPDGTVNEADDAMLLDLACSLNLCAQRIHALSRPIERIPETFKRRLFILRLKPLEALAVRVIESIFWKNRALARETAEAVEMAAAALRLQYQRQRALTTEPRLRE
ncbi:MAG: hypothetical protein RDU20_12945 [Desulfomonilaceae bacterium]|nr:hypothetical protein [Desulfomonilaceae bacterium]